MAARPGQQLLGTYVDRELADRFRAWARSRAGGASAELRRMVAEAVAGRDLPPPPGATGRQLAVRFKEQERLALLEAASARGTTPTNWLRSLALVHLARRPQWNQAELDELRALFVEVRRIGSGLDSVARLLAAAAEAGHQPAGQGDAAKKAAEIVRTELDRLGSVLTGNFDYWGLPDAERPAPARRSSASSKDVEALDEQRRRLRPRRRAARFVDAAETGKPLHVAKVVR